MYHPQDKLDSTKLEKLVFYDSFSYELLHQMDLGVQVEGDIETNRLSVSIDRDILNIVSHKGIRHTVLAFRLKEDFSMEEHTREDEELKGVLQRSIHHNLKTRTLPVFGKDDDGEGSESTRRKKRKQRKSGGRNDRLRSKNSKRQSSVSGSEDTDEWTP